MIELSNSAAYKNEFFARARYEPRRAKLDVIVREWFPVTQTFCLSLPCYVCALAREIAEADSDRRVALENAVLVPVNIAAEEFNNGEKGVDNIHYRMFARLGEPLGITYEELIARRRGSFSETGRLVEGIRNNLCDIYLGAGCLRVVEGTAYQIVDAMQHIFRSATWDDGKPVFSSRQLEYIALHLVLEKKHDAMSAPWTDHLTADTRLQARIKEGAERMCELFGDYWNAMAEGAFE